MTFYLDNSITWVIGGAQGSGVDSAANIFSRACAYAGYNIFGNREYYSNIKGEHSYFNVRISDEPARSHIDLIDILVSFDAETIFRHVPNVKEKGIVLYDKDVIDIKINEVPTIDKNAKERLKTVLGCDMSAISIRKVLDYASFKGVLLFEIPYFNIIEEFSNKIQDKSISKVSRMINTVALAFSLGLLNFDIDVLARAINYTFRSKSTIAKYNIQISDFVYQYLKSKNISQNRYKLNKKKPDENTIFIQGNQSAPLGKIVGGCRFQTYYPITPASDDSEFLESHQIIRSNGKHQSILVIQSEDEIAAITMAIGASLSGVRSATATSGPGFSLMSEAIGWAGMNEVPIVISLYQRAGPSTGLPTRHEQGDLLFSINAGHGEFPRIVLSSGDVEECFYDAIRVFNLAEKYQLPVIHLMDKYIANSITTCKKFDYKSINIDRGLLTNTVENSEKIGEANNYKRFDLKNPISQRIPLGTKNGIFWNTGDEHTEEGHITEDPTIRTKMMEKRMKKLEIVLEELSEKDMISVFGDTNSDICIISWGSTKGVIIDAIEKINREQEKKVKFIQVKLMHPFPSKVIEKYLKSKVIIDIEMNYSGQLGHIIKQNIPVDIDYQIVKYNGRPISLDELYQSLMDILYTNSAKRIVLENGT